MFPIFFLNSILSFLYIILYLYPSYEAIIYNNEKGHSTVLVNTALVFKMKFSADIICAFIK